MLSRQGSKVQPPMPMRMFWLLLLLPALVLPVLSTVFHGRATVAAACCAWRACSAVLRPRAGQLDPRLQPRTILTRPQHQPAAQRLRKLVRNGQA